MAESSRDQAEQAWVAAQKRTFTNWCNVMLSTRSVTIDDLESDLMDGSSLCHLVEVCSKKKLKGGFKKRANVQSGTETCMDRQFARSAQANCEKALNFLMDDEKVKLVNVGAYDIAEGNLRIILGLIWTLLLKYHLSEGAQEGLNLREYKAQLLAWINSLIGPETAYELNITNFKGNWKDGKALQALVDACQPRSMEGWNDDGDGVQKSEAAETAAQDLLDIPGIIAPKDVGVDDLSLIAYLDYYQDYSEKNKVTPRAKGEPYPKFSKAPNMREGKLIPAAAGAEPSPSSASGSAGSQYTGKKWGGRVNANVRLTWM